MFSNLVNNKNINKFLIYFFPISIILGNFAINFVIISSSIIMLISFVKLKDSLFNYLTKNQLLFFILFLLVTLYTTFFVSKNLELSLISWIKLIISIFFFFFLFKFLFEEKKIINYIKYLTLIVLFVAIDGWIQFVFDKNILGFEIVTGHGNRLTGFFGDEAVLGSFLSKLSLIVFFYVYFYKKNIYLALCASIFIIFSTLITNERIAFIIVFFGFFYFLFFFVF